MNRDCPNKQQMAGGRSPPAGNARGVGHTDTAVYLRFRVDGHLVWGLLDSGCEVSLVPGKLVRDLRLKVEPTNKVLSAANGTDIEVNGEITLPFYLNGNW